jgi:hypothetical protein
MWNNGQAMTTLKGATTNFGATVAGEILTANLTLIER